MTFTLIFGGLLAGGLGFFLRWWITRKWEVFRVDPDQVRIPGMCPVCLSHRADSIVEEDSLKRQTAYYVVATRHE